MPVFTIETPTGRKVDIEAADEATAIRGAQEWDAQQSKAEAPAPSGAIEGLQQGVSDLFAGPAETIKQFTPDMGMGADTALATAAQATAPNNYTPADIIKPTAEGQHWLDPRRIDLSAIPQAIAEQAPGLAVDATAMKVGKKIAGTPGAAVAGISSALLRSLGITSKTRAQERTGEADPEVRTSDKVIGGATALPAAALQALGAGRFLKGAVSKEVGAKGVTDAAKQFAKTSGTVGASTAGQDALTQAGTTVATPGGLRVDPERVIEAGIGGLATGGALAAPRAVAGARTAQKFKDFGGDNAEAAAALANRMQAAAEGRNLKDTSVGSEAVTKVRKNLNDEIRDSKNAYLKTARKDNNVDTDVKAAFSRAHDRSGDASPSEISAVAKVSPQTAALMKQATLLRKLEGQGTHKGGKFKGGLGASMEEMGIRLLKNPAAHVTAGGLTYAGLSGGAATLFGYTPAAMATLGGAYGGARAIDKMTGARSPAKRFVEKFSDGKTPIRAAPTPQAPATPAQAPTPMPWGRPQPAPTGPRIAQPAPAPVTPPTPINPLALPTAVTQPGQNLSKALMLAQSLKQKNAGNEQAEALARNSPMINEQGDLGNLSNPAMGKRAGDLVRAANVVKKLKAPLKQPKEPKAPKAVRPVQDATSDVAPKVEAAPVEAPKAKMPKGAIAARAMKTIKNPKKTEEAKAEAPKAEATKLAFEPLGGDELTYKGMSAKDIAEAEYAQDTARGKKIKYPGPYKAKIEKTVSTRRSSIESIIKKYRSESAVLQRLSDELDKTRSAARAKEAVEYYADNLANPEAVAALMNAFTDAKINALWPH